MKLCFVMLTTFAFWLVFDFTFVLVIQDGIAIEDASLTRFTLATSSSGTALAYNLSPMLTTRNRNVILSIENVKPLETMLWFSGSERAFVALNDTGVTEFRKAHGMGVFDLEVVVNGEERYYLAFVQVRERKLRATCPLKLQLVPQQKPEVAFQKEWESNQQIVVMPHLGPVWSGSAPSQSNSALKLQAGAALL
ncbi:hypothetical protein QOZ80_8BG0649130 [Eleusine coracana subsp. coracana]|nr:hypothetical protein QOZ80_8BG0649130 [Eleusine coracana subsp. coracana]